MIAATFADTSWSALLFLGACAGHTFLLTLGLNWVFGHPLPRKFLKAVRNVHHLLVLAGPLCLWATWGRGLVWEPEDVGEALYYRYVQICWFGGFVLLPVLTVRPTV